MKKLLISLLCIVSCAVAEAQIVTAKGVATVSYSGKITPQQKEAAYIAAQVASIERHFAESGEAEAENFEAIRPTVQEKLDTILMSTVVLSEQDQASFSKYSIAVRTELNLAKLRTALKANSAVAKSGAAGGTESKMAYVFVAREPASLKQFDARVVQRTEVDVKGKVNAQVSDTGHEGEAVGASSVTTTTNRRVNAKLDGNASRTVTTGGSSLQKMDEMAYRVLPMDNYKSSVTSVFSQAGFTVVDPEYSLSDADTRGVKADYAKGSELTPATMRGIVATLRKRSIPLVVLATFDMGIPTDDPSSGLRRVAVTVTARVMNVTGEYPKEVASVPAVQYFGLGSDSSIAGTKAMKDASLAATRDIVSRLNAAGVR